MDRRELDEMITAIQHMASCIGMQFVPDPVKIKMFCGIDYRPAARPAPSTSAES